MEFEPDEPVSDEARLLAQTKKVTVQPADPFLRPKDLPDPIAINETHRNIARDSEDTATLAAEVAQPGQSTQAQAPKFYHTIGFKMLVVSASLIVGLGAGIGYFFLFG